MDYKAFLSKVQDLELPYFGGSRVNTKDRRLRVEAEEPLVPGWYRFTTGSKTVGSSSS